MNTQRDENAAMPAPRLHSGQWAHLFGPGRAQTACRIVIDVVDDELVAAERFDGLSWVTLSAPEKKDLAESLFDANNVSDDAASHGLAPILTLPAWAVSAPANDVQNGEVPQPLLDIATRGGLEIDSGAVLYSARHGEMVLDHWLTYVDGGLRVHLRLLKLVDGELGPAMESPLSDPLSFSQASSMLESWCVERELAQKHTERLADDARRRAVLGGCAV